MRARVVLAFALVLPVTASARAQPSPPFPTATTLDALTTYPNFYHLKPIVVRGEVSPADGGRLRLVPAGGAGLGVDMVLRGDRPGLGMTEVRGQFWDVGRMTADDPNATGYELAEFVRARLGDRWPGHGELLAIKVTSMAPPQPPSANPSLRQLALDPDRYQAQTVSVSGQFAGRNLFGELPQAPRASRTDFVIRNAGGAIWVSGLPPRGRGWQLNPDSKLDSDQWLQVDGIVRHGQGLVWIEAKKLNPTTADAEEPHAEPAPAPPPPPAPEVVFTLPAQDDTDIPAGASVKIQTSRDLDPDSLARHIVVTYLGQPPGAPAIPAKATFDRTNRVLQLTFDQPFERFRTVKVELLEGITGTDGRPLKPFTLTFSVGGQ